MKRLIFILSLATAFNASAANNVWKIVYDDNDEDFEYIVKCKSRGVIVNKEGDVGDDDGISTFNEKIEELKGKGGKQVPKEPLENIPEFIDIEDICVEK